MPKIAALTDESLSTTKYCREAKSLPPDVRFFAIAWILERIALSRPSNGDGTDRVFERMEALEEAHWLTNEHRWETDESEAEYVELQNEFDRIDEERQVEVFREHGEVEMADLFQFNRTEFERRREAGRFAIFPVKLEGLSHGVSCSKSKSESPSELH